MTADLQARIDAAAQVPVDGAVRNACCEQSQCRCIFEIEGQCCARSSYLAQSCDKSDEQIVEDARKAEEWQGSRVDTCEPLYCDSFCGIRLACIDHACTASERDADCLASVACVLDQCLLADKVECRTRHDCEPDVLCTLNDEPSTPSEPRGIAGTLVALHDAGAAGCVFGRAWWWSRRKPAVKLRELGACVSAGAG